ncbi:hypothetical protein NC651_021772 [Populus alba x Populus x berolinensis]|nr:hypothetical protein NC651_021772 [Populus alba x Populus x berolinensis]
MLRLQEVLLWIKSVVEECGENITTEQLKDYVWKTLNSGKLTQFRPDQVSKLCEVVPPILTELGKASCSSFCFMQRAQMTYNHVYVSRAVKNPWPNVDANGGVLLNYYGLTEASSVLPADMGASSWIATREAEKCYNGLA